MPNSSPRRWTSGPTLLGVGLLVALGLSAGGWFAAEGMIGLRTDDRYVIVKGSAEELVEADLVVWPLAHSVGGDDLPAVQRQLEANTAIIRGFFSRAGFEPEEIVVSPPRLEDRWLYASEHHRPPERFRHSNTVSLRTTKVDEALEALRQSGDLVTRGVMIDNSAPEFEYTRLSEIKPGLIARATAEARESALQFANDSGSELGGIRLANQGVVTISDRDQSSPQVKKVRVVTTVQYFLRD